MLRRRCAWALVAPCLLSPAPAPAASGQVVLTCKGQAVRLGTPGAGRSIDDAVLVLDFDRNSVFQQGLEDTAPITGIKKFFITWESEDGTRTGFLNRLTLEAVEQEGIVRTTYACGLYAHLLLKAVR